MPTTSPPNVSAVNVHNVTPDLVTVQVAEDSGTTWARLGPVVLHADGADEETLLAELEHLAALGRALAVAADREARVLRGKATATDDGPPVVEDCLAAPEDAIEEWEAPA